MNSWVQVDKLKDKESLDAKTLNRPVDQLASRTDYLKRRLGSIMESGVQSALILTDVDLVEESSDLLQVGNIVYRGVDGFRKAQAKMSLYDDFKAADSAFTIGILISKTDSKGDVLIYGKLDLDPSSSTILKSNIMQSGETFSSGRYYLSAIEAGKITRNPSGPLIYIGSFHADDTTTDRFSSGAVGYINTQFLDIGTSHVHRAYALKARPAGHVEDGSVIGYLPIAATASSDPSGSSDPDRHYPTLIFGGTWTSTNDVNYTFVLENNTDWGTVRLDWYENDDVSKYKSVEIPAQGVFVDLDNGLKVKILFPEATSTKAFTVLSDAERTWKFSFPDAGKGWVNHAVDAIASIKASAADSSDSSSDTAVITPSLHALISGAWPENDNTVEVLFPGIEHDCELADISATNDKDKVTIDGVDYQFVPVGETAEDGYTAVTKAATINESLLNLAAAVNASLDTAFVFVDKNTLVVCDHTVSFPYAAQRTVTDHKGIQSAGIDIVGGTIPVTIAYDANYEVYGSVLLNKPTYLPSEIGNLEITVFASGATTGTNYNCTAGTRLYATAYDYVPDAMYDYVMGLHQEVDYYFPPVPAQSAGLFVNGVEMENAALFKENPTYTVGRKTLHWMDGTVDRLPWPETCADHDDVIDPSLDKTMVFYFIVGFQCSSGPVTSIVPAPGSAVKVYTYGTNDEAYTGDLMIDAALDLSVSEAGVQGYQVAKQGKGGKLLAGPIVERIVAGSGISVTQSAGCPDGQGTVTVSLDNGSLRGSFNEIALENAKQEKLGLFPYVSLLGWGSSGNIPSAFTAMMRVPSNLDADKDYQLQLRLVMFGSVGYEEPRQQAAGIELEYNILPDYTDKTNLSLKNGLLIPDTPSSRVINVPFGHIEGSSWKYIAFDPFVATTDSSAEKESDVRVSFSDLPIPSVTEFSTKTPTLKPGYLVAVRISRTSMSDTVVYDAYTGPVGFLSLEWTLEEA